MRAIVIDRPGGPDVLSMRDVPTPEPGWQQVRVRVRAAGLNRADVMQRRGSYPAPADAPADIPGLEYAGVIDAVGAGVTTRRVGERVFGIVAGGGYAEYLVTHERLAVPVPEGLDDSHAAACPEAFITAHDALFTQGRLRTGDRVLIHAVGSGVGLSAVQLAALAHCETFGTARTEEKLRRAEPLGLRHALTAGGFASAVAARTGGTGVDVVVDFVGRGYLAGNLEALAPRGRLVVVGLMGGARDEIDLGLVLRKRLTVVGTVLRARPLEEKIAATLGFAREVVPLLATGAARPVVDLVLPFDRASEAHARMESNSNFGKIVLSLPGT